MEKLIDVRYPPYAGKLAKFRKTSELKPNFDRQGNETWGVQYWLGFMFRMGGESKKDVFVRWAAFALMALAAKMYADVGKLPSYLK
jgi:beta-apo-4'-carotenal oxygenase